MAAVTVHSDSGAQENKICHCFHFFPIYCHEVMGLDAVILVFWMLTFKPTFSLSSFTFIKRLFSASSLPALRVVSSAYLRLLIFLPAILIPACASSSPVFLMMYSAYKLNKQGDNIQPWHTPFPVWNQSVVPCPSSSNYCFLTCIQVSQEAGQVVCYSYLFQNFPQLIVIHTIKGFGIVKKAEIDVFLELSCFFDDPISRPHRSIGQNILEINPHIQRQLIFNKHGKAVQWKNVNLYNKWCWNNWIAIG